MTKIFSKNALIQLGRNLRDTDSPSSKNLALLQEYRLSHKDLIKQVFDIICTEALIINDDAICAYRIKRIDSIIRKLRRLKGSVELKSMRDIAGCRCILQSDAEVFKLMNNLKKTSLQLIQKPNIYMGPHKKESGYGSIHMYVTLPEFEKLSVEIQIRTIEQHDWATFVETIDLLYGTKLKEGICTTTQEQYNDFYRMHQILSKQDNYRNKNEDKELINAIIKYDILGRLENVLVSNIAKVRHQWAEMMSNFTYPQYFYIGTTDDNSPTIAAYASYSEAEQYYYDSFEKNSNKNQVIVSLTNPTYDTICMAYSNYMLVCHKFTHKIQELFTKVISDDISNDIVNEISLYYCSIAKQLTRHIDVEIHELLKSQGKYNKEVLREWVYDVKHNLEQRKEDFVNLNNASIKMVFIGKSKGIYKIFRVIIYYIVTAISPNYIINKIKQLKANNDRVENI